MKIKRIAINVIKGAAIGLGGFALAVYSFMGNRIYNNNLVNTYAEKELHNCKVEKTLYEIGDNGELSEIKQDNIKKNIRLEYKVYDARLKSNYTVTLEHKKNKRFEIVGKDRDFYCRDFDRYYKRFDEIEDSIEEKGGKAFNVNDYKVSDTDDYMIVVYMPSEKESEINEIIKDRGKSYTENIEYIVCNDMTTFSFMYGNRETAKGIDNDKMLEELLSGWIEEQSQYVKCNDNKVIADKWIRVYNGKEMNTYELI